MNTKSSNERPISHYFVNWDLENETRGSFMTFVIDKQTTKV